MAAINLYKLYQKDVPISTIWNMGMWHPSPRIGLAAPIARHFEVGVKRQKLMQKSRVFQSIAKANDVISIMC